MSRAWIAGVWLACGTLAYGIILGDFQGRYQTVRADLATSDVIVAITMGLLGPIGLATALVMTNGWTDHGVRWWPV